VKAAGRLLAVALGIVLCGLRVAAYGEAGAGGVQSARDQVARGRALFGQHCATCHIPGGIGPELTPDTLAPMGTARGLFDFVRAAMPQNAPGSLKEQEYWDILAHVLSVAGIASPGVPLGPETADSVRLAK